MIVLIGLVACLTPAPAVSPTPPSAAAPKPKPPEPGPVVPPEGPFQLDLAPGLTLAGYLPPAISGDFSRVSTEADLSNTDPRLYVVTVDPKQHELVYLTSRARATGPEWAEKHGLSVVWNPGMFEPDGRATGYTRSGTTVTQDQVRRNRLYQSFFLGDEGFRVRNLRPPSGKGKYADFSTLTEDDREALNAAHTVSQSLSILRAGKAVYPPRKNQWSELTYGVDRAGQLLVVFSRYPYEMRHLGALVEALPIGALDLLHGEGGPEATLVVDVGDFHFTAVGSYETGFYGDDNTQAWPLPSAMGVRAR